MTLTFPDWRKLLRTARPVTGTTTLDRRHVYILPTRQGLAFALVLLGMLLGAINYSLSLGFVLTFLLGGLGVVAMLHTWRNLAGLTVSAGRTAPVFAGEEALFGLIVTDRNGRERYAIGMRQGKGDAMYADIPAMRDGALTLPVKSWRRGWLEPGRLTVFTEFPLGLFHAWSYVELANRCLVYPAPAVPGLPLPPVVAEGMSGGQHTAAGDDDFSGLRGYHYGDSPRRVDWKASAKEQGLFTKQFLGVENASLWLDWNQLPVHDAEQKISVLTRWVLDAKATGQPYGLRLPGREIAPGYGEQHDHQCLEALALI